MRMWWRDVQREVPPSVKKLRIWFGAVSAHVLGYTIRAGGSLLGDLAAKHSDGRVYRVAAVALALGVGAATAVATYSLAQPWLGHFGH